LDAVINGSNASFTVNSTINGSAISDIYPLARANGRAVTSSTGEKVLNLTVDGYTVITLANTPGAIGYGNSIFGATDVDAAKVALQAALGLVGSSGGNGSTAISPASIASGIDQSLDVDTVVLALNELRTTTVKTTATPLSQTTLTIASGTVANYLIPANCRSLTICITSGSLVYYTEDGATPTTSNCWLAYGSKEIWDSNIPVGATLKLLATSATTIIFQPRT
jgi:hypothetical protein